MYAQKNLFLVLVVVVVLVSCTVPSLTTTPSLLARLIAINAKKTNGTAKRNSNHPIMLKIKAGPYRVEIPSLLKRRRAVTKVEKMRIWEIVARRAVKIYIISGISKEVYLEQRTYRGEYRTSPQLQCPDTRQQREEGDSPESGSKSDEHERAGKGGAADIRGPLVPDISPNLPVMDGFTLTQHAYSSSSFPHHPPTSQSSQSRRYRYRCWLGDTRWTW